MKTIFLSLLILTIPAGFKAQNDSRKVFATQLTLQLENEKLAMDFYNAMYARWKVLAFKNMARCEMMHMRVLDGLLDEYRENGPYQNPGKGKFISKDLNDKYSSLMSDGINSENDALTAAGSIEELYIGQIEKLMSYPEGKINIECLDNLLQSSISHLNLMVCHLRHRGIEYKPVTLSVVKYINCIGDHYSDLNKDLNLCPSATEDKCPYMREQ